MEEGNFRKVPDINDISKPSAEVVKGVYDEVSGLIKAIDSQGNPIYFDGVSIASALSAVLAVGNTIPNGQTIDAENGTGQLDLRNFADSAVLLSSDAGAFTNGLFFADLSTAMMGYGFNLIKVDANGIKLGKNGVDDIFEIIFAGNHIKLSYVGDYPDDIAAAAAGVPIGGLYQNNGAMRLRIS